MAPYLGLDLKLPTSKIITNFSKQSFLIQDEAKKIEKIENYMKHLEEERRKIEVFKRELPLCIILLDDVICGLEDELENCRKSVEKNKVLEGEELMPLKSKLEDEGGVKLEKNCKDEKMNWMSSAQLWSDNNHTNENNNHNFNNANNNKISKKKTESGDESGHCPESFASAFVPFNGLKKEDGKATGGLSDLSLVSGAVTIVADDEAPKPAGRCHVSSNGDGHVSTQSQQQQGLRKARRCWSPELHRRFVVALQQLGGAPVATPKQIRELMKVDGLTNDEVKSHLQKYRLHTRRVPNSSSSTMQSIPLTGGPWASREQQYTTSLQSTSKSASPEGPLQFAVSASCYEDGKSESCSWK